MQITWYGHSAFKLHFGGTVMLIDPFFTGNPAFVSDKAEIETDQRAARRQQRGNFGERQDRHGEVASTLIRTTPRLS